MKPPQEPRRVEWKGKTDQLRLSLGEEFYLQFHRHGSVGEDAEFSIGNENVIVHERTETEYLHPEHMKDPAWTGGDAERGRWFFRAQGRGSTTLTIRILFRFEVEEEHTLNITVE
ncbi:MAG: hypothetical protein ACP6KW_08635 [Candidatus Thorarchaeota archaeon]